MSEEEWVKEAEFRGRAHFAEIAEALETTTEYIFAARMEAGRWFILYTPGYGDGDHTMYSAWLKRGEDGILRLDEVARAYPGMWERMEKEIRARIEEQMGEDDER